ncbi:unnamed protein product [Meganyctiphanes norvegica]|uniref:Chitin-binding type-2 domain-containing protein n=1 Tax=Meganyctiphanes norvegica TaxID=48144 RepID=A0AAV2R115_MEGNR
MKLLVALFLVGLAQASVFRDDSHGFECHGVGAFPDPDCKGFHVCQLGDEGDFVETFYKCDEGTMYDFKHKICTAKAFECPTPINKPLEI